MGFCTDAHTQTGLVRLSSRHKYGKSPHIVAAVAVADLTQGREISTGSTLAHIPGLTQHNTHLVWRRKAKCSLRLPHEPKNSVIFFHSFFGEGGGGDKSRMQVLWGTAPTFPEQMSHNRQLFQEFKRRNYLTRKVQNVTPKKIKGEEQRHKPCEWYQEVKIQEYSGRSEVSIKANADHKWHDLFLRIAFTGHLKWYDGPHLAPGP